MTTVVLLRHGRTTANAGGVLAGWTPGVELDDAGRAQVQAVGERLAKVPLAAIVSSPLERCRQTAGAVAAGRELDGADRRPPRRGALRRLDRPDRSRSWSRSRSGRWSSSTRRPPSSPASEGEGLAATQARAVAAVRAWNAQLGPDAVWLACSHGDVIKAMLADALGLHLDQFQRIVVDPASVSSSATRRRGRSWCASTTSAATSPARPAPKRGRRRKASSDAVVGGGAGAPA